MIARTALKENLLVYLFCLAVLWGPSISELFSFDANREREGYVDTRTYLGLAAGDLQQSPKRRYRVIIPAMAAAINSGAHLWTKLAPKSFKSDFALPFSFFVVNLALMGLFGVLIYQYLRSYHLGVGYSLSGLLAMLSCRYSFVSTGSPMVESLYFIVIALTLLGIRKNNTAMLVTAIFLGPFAKELFLFIAPLIFFFGHIPRARQLLYFMLSAIFVFGFRYLFDRYASLPPTEGVASDVYHMKGFLKGAMNLFSGKGLYEVLSITGPWILFIIAALRNETGRRTLKGLFTPLHCWFLVSVLLQVVLSGSVHRMFYLAMPFLCLLLANSFKSLQGIFVRDGRLH